MAKDDDLIFPGHFFPQSALVDPSKITKPAPKDTTVTSGLASENKQKYDSVRRQRLSTTRSVDAAIPQSHAFTADDADSDNEVITPEIQSTEMESLAVGDADKVETFLRSRLKGMQQLAVKRIAKAWIKGICPKKQAKFPYHNKRHEEKGIKLEEAVPEWWPDVEICRFKEPDHIKRTGKQVDSPDYITIS